MPFGDADGFVEEVNRLVYLAELQPYTTKLLARVKAAIKGKDMRVHNRHNTQKVKRPRVELDLRKKAS
jgi:hypothetical protein